MKRKKSFLIMLFLMLFCITNKIQADGYPCVSAIYAKGEYLFLNSWPCIKITDGKISLLKDKIDVRLIDRPFNWSSENDLWGYEGSMWGLSWQEGEKPLYGHLVRYDGKAWTTYAQPLIPWGSEAYVFYIADMTVLAAFNPEVEGQLILYYFDGTDLKELTRSPMRDLSYNHTYTSEDRIVFGYETKGRIEYYSYSVTLNKWRRDSQLLSPPDKFPRENKDYYGDWESIATNNKELMFIAVSDNAEHTIWGSDGGCYLAFVRDGIWMEVALLHPVVDGGPGTNMDPMREVYGKNGMRLAVIKDSDGYVNVHTNPSLNAPVIAIILENVTYMYKTIPGNSSWVKVLLPSGTKGYISRSRLKPLKEEPVIIYDGE